MMRKKTGSLLLACTAMIALAGCATPHHASAWAYKVVEGNYPPNLESELNQLGADGWVVVSSSSAPDPNSTNPKVVVILKRHAKAAVGTSATRVDELATAKTGTPATNGTPPLHFDWHLSPPPPTNK